MTDAGTRIAAGDTVLVVVAAANRTPQRSTSLSSSG